MDRARPGPPRDGVSAADPDGPRARPGRASGDERLPLRAEVEDPLLIQLEPDARAGAALAAHDVLWSDGSRVLVALGADAGTDLPAGTDHGQVSLLAPSPDGARTFAVHAGFTDRAVRDRNVPLAELVANAATSFGLPS
ncbi:MAG: hypothetical protein ACR2H2_12545 [Solirubrobacteraceae bacterium]